MLIEAALTAAVIAVGLVFISRSMSSSLSALSTLRRYDPLVRAAESALSARQAQAALFNDAAASDGRCEEPDGAYRCVVAIEPVDTAALGLAPGSLSAVAVTVSPEASGAPSVRLRTVWPANWVRR